MSKKNLHKCPSCGREVDYIKRLGISQRFPNTVNIPPKVEAVHLPLNPDEVSVKNLTAPSTECRARRDLGHSAGYCETVVN